MVAVSERDLVEALRNIESQHCVANQYGLYRLTIHSCVPISILGNRSVEIPFLSQLIVPSIYVFSNFVISKVEVFRIS